MNKEVKEFLDKSSNYSVIKYIDKLQQENKQLKDNWNKLCVYLLDKIDRSWEIEEQCYEDIYEQMKELEKGDSDE